MSETKSKEINILLLGETGVGKSTFINGFANYLNYETLEEAEGGETICLIPTDFVITDENYVAKPVRYPPNVEDENENFKQKGQSVTQSCRAYTFKYGDVLVRLIDTPGVGDTRGVEQDKKNFENLLSFIAEYDELHLICILLLPNMQRLTPSFQYCLMQLLCNLQKDASRNMVFLFTNTRQTFYRPKNTLVLLKEVLSAIKTNPPFVEIPVEKHTMYCLDNDSFQFLIALRNGITFSEDERDDYSGSWTKSVKECMRLINYIASGKDGQPLKPHSIQNMLSINETRRLIVTLNKPIAAITEKLGENLMEIEKQKKDIESCGDESERLLKLIESSTYKPELAFYDFIPIFNLFTIGYKAIKQANANGEVNELKDKLKNAKGCEKLKQDMLKKLKDLHDEYLDERKIIVEASAKFALFLKTNAIAAYNDSYREYIQEQIENLKTAPNKDEEKVRELIDGLEKMLKVYEKEKKIVEDAMNKGSNDKGDMSLENINKLIKNLYELKFTGEEIRKMHEESKNKRSGAIKKEVEHYLVAKRARRFFKDVKNFFGF